MQYTGAPADGRLPERLRLKAKDGNPAPANHQERDMPGNTTIDCLDPGPMVHVSFRLAEAVAS